MDAHAGHEHAQADHGHAGHGRRETNTREDEHGHEMEGGPGIGGRPIIAQDIRKLKDFVYLTRWENAFDLSDDLTAVFGVSSLLGPNSSGPAGSTWIYGLDMKWRWQPANSFPRLPVCALADRVHTAQL